MMRKPEHNLGCMIAVLCAFSVKNILKAEMSEIQVTEPHSLVHSPAPSLRADLCMAHWTSPCSLVQMERALHDLDLACGRGREGVP